MKWFLTEEWNEGRKSIITAYGQKSDEEIEKLEYEMNRFSPFDYVDSQTFDTKESYESYLRCMSDSSTIEKANN